VHHVTEAVPVVFGSQRLIAAVTAASLLSSYRGAWRSHSGLMKVKASQAHVAARLNVNRVGFEVSTRIASVRVRLFRACERAKSTSALLHMGHSSYRYT